jgi:hypothetical protein
MANVAILEIRRQTVKTAGPRRRTSSTNTGSPQAATGQMSRSAVGGGIARRGP